MQCSCKEDKWPPVISYSLFTIVTHYQSCCYSKFWLDYQHWLTIKKKQLSSVRFEWYMNVCIRFHLSIYLMMSKLQPPDIVCLQVECESAFKDQEVLLTTATSDRLYSYYCLYSKIYVSTSPWRLHRQCMRRQLSRRLILVKRSTVPGSAKSCYLQKHLQVL